MRYGYFDDEHNEYVITDPRTPVKWINYIGTLNFGGFVDHTGGALLCRQDPALNRITKYITQMPAGEFKGTTLYLRIHEGAGYRVFSPFYVPTLDAYEHYECRVGLGYTRLDTQFYGIRCVATIFVPRDGVCELRDIQVTNCTGMPVEVDAIPVVEYTHPDALKQLTNADWVPQTMTSRAVRQQGGQVVLIQYPFMLRDMRINYFTSNLPASSYETDRKVFLGENEYRGWSSPGALDQAELGNGEALRGDNIHALLHPLGMLAAGETRRLVTILGQAENLEIANPVMEQYRQLSNVDSALNDLKHFWQEYLDHCQVTTPDVDMNRMLNIHNPRQCYTTLNWSRYLSYYQLGYGARGIGFRDSSQDVMGVMANVPDEARQLLDKLLSVQKRDGSAMHQFNPLSMVGAVGDSAENPDAPHYYSDDHLWVILAVIEYVKETGDFDYLKKVIPFYEKDGNGSVLGTGSVFDHLKRGLAFTRSDTGAHGLPKLGYADWNDTINLRAGAESVFTACLYGSALLEMISLLHYLGDGPQVQAYTADYEKMKQVVNTQAWDGEWYVNYFDSDGTPLGSHENSHGQIFNYGQSWAVISGFAGSERGISALHSVHSRLSTSRGIKVSTPGFNGFDARRGGITTYPPGAKENCGIFLHTNPWVMIAETMLGNGDMSYAYYRQINPVGRNDEIEHYECEPYVYPQNILGDEHPQFGLARNSWLSGTASWAYQAGIKYILGIRATFTGLLVDPCIPKEWDRIQVMRAFRGTRYDIQVQNPKHVSQGVSMVEVDGMVTQGNVLPIFHDGKIHRVSVTLG